RAQALGRRGRGARTPRGLGGPGPRGRGGRAAPRDGDHARERPVRVLRPRPGRRRRARRAHPPDARRRGHRRPRVHARATEPRRGVPRAHRPAHGGRRDDRGGGLMAVDPTATAADLRAPEANALRAAVALEHRPDRPSPVSATLTYTWRALLKIKHVPEQLFDVTVSPI